MIRCLEVKGSIRNNSSSYEDMGTLVLGECEDPVLYEARIRREDRAALVGKVTVTLGYPQGKHPLGATIWDAPFASTIIQRMEAGTTAEVAHFHAGTYPWGFHAFGYGNALIKVKFVVSLSNFTMRTSLEELRSVIQQTLEAIHGMLEQEVQRFMTVPS